MGLSGCVPLCINFLFPEQKEEAVYAEARTWILSWEGTSREGSCHYRKGLLWGGCLGLVPGSCPSEVLVLGVAAALAGTDPAGKEQEWRSLESPRATIPQDSITSFCCTRQKMKVLGDKAGHPHSPELPTPPCRPPTPFSPSLGFPQPISC